MSVTVVTPSIPPRGGHGGPLERALASVRAQSLRPREVVVEFDEERLGAAATRQRALDRVRTSWTAFLDDDDEFKPEHLAVLRAAADEHEADYVYSWYDVEGGTDPAPQFFGVPWSDDAPHITTITVLVRTDLAQEVGFQDGGHPGWRPGEPVVGGEDHRFTLGCVEAGAKIVHVPERTWIWHHHGANTSGLPSRW